MNNKHHLFFFASLSLLLSGGAADAVYAQSPIPHSFQYMQAAPARSTAVPFATAADIANLSVPEQPIEWGMDVAWVSEDNVVRGTNFIGKDILQVGRVSFQPSDLIGDDGQLSASQKSYLQNHLDIMAKSGVKNIILNCDHEVLCNKESYPNADQNYANYYGKPAEWVKVIKASAKYCQSKGFTVVSISPFNEPDYTDWKEGTKTHFKEIARLLREDSYFDGMRISAGNTLNCDQALPWYEAVKPYVSEGNTHQLAGSFDNYAKFWETVRADGNHATADEVHNTGEAFIGAHYGMQTAIWWGWEGATRAAYCRASYYGKEIGYAENRSAWSAATVYKRNDGHIEAFLGTSKRQATPSDYEFVATDHPAYFEGYGPCYTYGVSMPGGTGYQQGQTNADHMVAIHSGEDVPAQPLSAGTYVIMNEESALCIGTYSDIANSGSAVALRKYSVNSHTTSINGNKCWRLEPVKYVSGDMAPYFFLHWGKDDAMLMDIKDWNRSEGGTIIAVYGGKGANEQWYVEYAGNNYWYIRSRHSGLYLQSEGTAANASVKQAFYTGATNQRWRFMPVDRLPQLEQEAPAQPTGLQAVAASASVRLSWTANTDEDVAGYMVLRDGDVIGRMIEGTEFLDNDVRPGVDHQYAIKAIDKSLNASAASETVSACLDLSVRSLIVHYDFDTDSLDASGNQLDYVAAQNVAYSTTMKKQGTRSLRFNDESPYVMLPSTVGYYSNFTWAGWVYIPTSSGTWQRIFDFGNDTDHYCFLTTNTGSQMRLAIKNGGEEQQISVAKPAYGWHYVAVVFDTDRVSLYLDGELTTNEAITIRLSDFCPKRCFLGRSQFVADPFFSGYMDDVRIYNFALTLDELKALNEGEEISGLDALNPAIEETLFYDLQGRTTAHPTRGFYLQNGRKVRY